MTSLGLAILMEAVYVRHYAAWNKSRIQAATDVMWPYYCFQYIILSRDKRKG